MTVISCNTEENRSAFKEEFEGQHQLCIEEDMNIYKKKKMLFHVNFRKIICRNHNYKT